MLGVQLNLENGILPVINDKSGGLGRAIFAWALFDKNNTLLVKDSYILGKQKETLLKALDSYGAGAQTLFISVEPAASFIDVQKLTAVLDSIQLQKIVIGCGFSAAHQCNQWSAWLTKQTCSVEYLEQSTVSARISRGAVQAHILNRPWVTCVSAANLNGGRASLAQIETDIGFKSYLKQLLTVNAAVWCSTGAAELSTFIEGMSSTALGNVAINTDEIKDLQHRFSQLVKTSACSVCIFCDMAELNCLMQAGLVDEIVHHVVSGCPSEQSQAIDEPLNSSEIDFSNWKLVSSAPLGNGSRVVLINNTSDSTVTGAR